MDQLYVAVQPRGKARSEGRMDDWETWVDLPGLSAAREKREHSRRPGGAMTK